MDHYRHRREFGKLSILRDGSWYKPTWPASVIFPNQFLRHDAIRRASRRTDSRVRQDLPGLVSPMEPGKRNRYPVPSWKPQPRDHTGSQNARGNLNQWELQPTADAGRSARQRGHRKPAHGLGASDDRIGSRAACPRRSRWHRPCMDRRRDIRIRFLTGSGRSGVANLAPGKSERSVCTDLLWRQRIQYRQLFSHTVSRHAATRCARHLRLDKLRIRRRRLGFGAFVPCLVGAYP